LLSQIFGFKAGSHFHSNDSMMNKVLIIQSASCPEDCGMPMEMIQKFFTDNSLRCDIVSVPSVNEIAHAMNIMLEVSNYSGILTLGSVITEGLLYYQIMASEMIRAINDIAMHYSAPLGLGIVITEDLARRELLWKGVVTRALQGCLRLIKLKVEYESFDSCLTYDN